MADAQESEIRRLFLEEAQEYLNEIEAFLLELPTRSTDGRVDAALRAAHSIKGGAAMMGFGVLSNLAHRYEDCLKVMWAKRKTLTIAPELEQLLLSGIDCLRQVTAINRQEIAVDESWVASHATPIFDKLHEHLGDPSGQDMTLDDPDADVGDMAVLLFESEVENSLSQIEGLLDGENFADLRDAVQTAALELGGLGEMLELGAFANLCQSIAQVLETSPDQTEQIARAALQAWRRSQALILVGQVDLLPHTLEWIAATDVLDADVTVADADVRDVMVTTTAITNAIGVVNPVDRADVVGAIAGADRADVTTTQMPEVTLLELATDLEFESLLLSNASLAVDDWLGDEEALRTDELPDQVPDAIHPALLPLTPRSEARPSFPKPLTTQEAAPSPEPAIAETIDSTVRVSVRQLDQLNDLFGELTVERNGLRLTLDRMRGLVRLLALRMRGLEQTNAHLRTAYDRVSTQSNLPDTPASAAFQAKPSRVLVWQGEPNPVTSSVLGTETDYHNGSSSAFDVLEMDRYSELHLLSQDVMETIVQVQEVTGDLELNLEETDHLVRDLNRTARQMQTGLTQVRMRPLTDVVGRFPRALRELSLQHGKPVDLKVYGGGTLIDRAILEALSDPLMHLLRNCFDHGIESPDVRRATGKPEQGTIEIRAAYRGNRTIITISDDGGGINLAKIRAKAETLGFDAAVLAAASERDLLDLIFEPGFSTADQVTMLSGRGVGMDVVRTNLRRVRGEIRVDTQLGVGTSFTISVPFTLSVLRVLLVESVGMMLAFPKDVIEELILPNPHEVLHTVGGEFLNWDGEMVPLVHLDRQLHFNCPPRPLNSDDTPIINQPTVLVISQGQELVGIQIDRCWGEQEVAIRQVESTIPLPQGFSGCAILGDGRVVPLADANQLLVQVTPANQPASAIAAPPNLTHGITNGHTPPSSPVPSHSQANTVLIVDDSVNVRRYLALALEKAGFRVEQAKDGQDALDKLLSGLQVQAIVCDIEMPRLDGYGFLARLKSDPTFQGLPVAMLTSRIGDKHRRLGMSLGAAAYFSKPYQEQDLLKTLNQLITNAAALRN